MTRTSNNIWLLNPLLYTILSNFIGGSVPILDRHVTIHKDEHILLLSLTHELELVYSLLPISSNIYKLVKNRLVLLQHPQSSLDHYFQALNVKHFVIYDKHSLTRNVTFTERRDSRNGSIA